MRCRWILTWKPVDDAKADQPKHVPKARLVVLGYEDPLVHEIPRDSPTMSKLSRMLILQLAASKGWDIESFDIKTAFLRGQEQGDRILGIEPTAELREKMKMRPNEVLRLLKGAYGRVDAPYLWFMELKRGLESLGFTPSPFDPCAFILEHPKSGMTEGIVEAHVDDGLCCGSEFFQRRLQALADMFDLDHTRKEISPSLDSELNNNLTIQYTSTRHNTSMTYNQFQFHEPAECILMSQSQMTNDSPYEVCLVRSNTLL